MEIIIKSGKLILLSQLIWKAYQAIWYRQSIDAFSEGMCRLCLNSKVTKQMSVELLEQQSEQLGKSSLLTSALQLDRIVYNDHLETKEINVHTNSEILIDEKLVDIG